MNIHTITSFFFSFLHWKSSRVMAEILQQLQPFFHSQQIPQSYNDGEPIADKKNALHLG